MERIFCSASSIGQTAFLSLFVIAAFFKGFELVSPAHHPGRQPSPQVPAVHSKPVSLATRRPAKALRFSAPGDINWFISNEGSDMNDGISPGVPKRHIDSVDLVASNYANLHNGVHVGLDAGSTFREQYDNFASNVTIDSYNMRNRLAKITGMDVISQWSATPGRKNVYEHVVYHTIDVQSPGYNNILLAEIDTLKEKVNAITAVNYPRLVSSLDECERFAGTYYPVPLSTNPVTVYIHPSSGIAGSNGYRYEATVRKYAIDGFYVKGGTYQNLFLQSSGYGFGMLAAGNNSVVKNVVFQGGGTHHTVIRNGWIDSCLFLPGPRGINGNIAVVFSEADGRDKENRITNTIFNNIDNPIYTHTDASNNFKFMAMDKVYCFGDAVYSSLAFSAANTDSIQLSNSYAEGYERGWDGALKRITINNCILRKISHAAIQVLASSSNQCQVDIANTLIVTNGTDNNQAENDELSASAIRAPFPERNIKAEHMIIHAYSTWHKVKQPVKLFNVGGTFKAYNNIYICDVNDNNEVHVMDAINGTGVGTAANIASDSNVFVVARGSGFHWTVGNGNNSSVSSLNRWQALTGQDSHSIMIDLRKNPLGLKAIFADPENGNWTLTGSPQADSVKKLSAGMTTPPLFYPESPVVKERITSFIVPGGFSMFTAVKDSGDQALLHWQTYNESDAVSFDVESSTDSTRFGKTGEVSATGDGKNHTYSFTASLPLQKFTYYRLKRIFSDSTFRYSPVIALEQKMPEVPLPAVYNITVYPNPSQHTLLVRHPARSHAGLGIYDITGRLLQYISIPAGSVQSSFSLDRYMNGTYVIKWTGDNHESYTTSFLRNN